MPNYDAIVIGAGQFGPALAWRLAAAGQKVAVIERKFFSGTCVNTGCTPTKALVASAYAAYLARRANNYGLTIGGAVEVDMQAVKARRKLTLGLCPIWRKQDLMSGNFAYRHAAPQAAQAVEATEPTRVHEAVSGRPHAAPCPHQQTRHAA